MSVDKRAEEEVDLRMDLPMDLVRGSADMSSETQAAAALEPAVSAAKERSQQPLFSATVTASDIRSPKGNALLGSVTGERALRIVHRGHEIKVVVTEARYLELLTFWQMFQHGAAGQPMPMTTASAELAAAEREDAELAAVEASDRD